MEGDKLAAINCSSMSIRHIFRIVDGNALNEALQLEFAEGKKKCMTHNDTEKKMIQQIEKIGLKEYDAFDGTMHKLESSLFKLCYPLTIFDTLISIVAAVFCINL